MTVPTIPTPDTSLAPKLRAVRVGVRDDLEVSRHLFRGEPYYIVRDPLTFQSQRVGVADYEVLISIRNDRSLGEIFEQLLGKGPIEKGDEEHFYQLVMSLHGLGFLHLPVSDAKLLYKRFELREQAKRKDRFRSILFYRIPLVNPSAFLDRTINYVRPLFSRAAFGLWLTLVLAGVYVVACRWHEVLNPLHGVLAAKNLPLIWLTLIGLKVFHEFGHAYACRHYGGHVPEMGVYLLLFTPCAYVDATASWGFTKRRQRVYVCLAGMYVEAAIAAAAVLVWAATGPSLLNAIAYNVIFLASAVTILFNINPLMRFDGYYILSDMVEIPNLRQRSADYLKNVFKRVALGVRTKTDSGTRGLRTILATYGIAAMIYRVALMIAITALLATKFMLVGLLFGVFVFGGLIVSVTLKLTSYLWYHEDASRRRALAVAISLVLLLLLPAGIMWIPISIRVQAAAVMVRETELIVRAQTPGLIEELAVEPGTYVEEGEALVRLRNVEQIEQLLYAQTNVKLSRSRREAYRVDDMPRFAQESRRLDGLVATLHARQRRVDDLEVRAPIAGHVVDCVRRESSQQLLGAGDPVATIVSGAWQVRAILTEDDVASAAPTTGDRVEFRAPGLPGQTLSGRILRVAPMGSRMVEIPTLTHLGGGDIAVDLITGHAAQPYFEVVVEFDADDDLRLLHGMTGYVCLDGGYESIGKVLSRRVVKFWKKLSAG